MKIVDELVFEALKRSGTKERFSGVVAGYDRAHTTIFIRSGERTLLAFADPKLSLKSGDQISFRIHGIRAIDVRKEIPAA